MARYKPYDTNQVTLLPVSFPDYILCGNGVEGRNRGKPPISHPLYDVKPLMKPKRQRIY